MPYELYYWPTIQGRGEFIRLALEEAGADYLDVARLPEKDGMGLPALLRLLDGAEGRPPFAPPFLKADGLLIGQTANILLFLGPRLGLAPRAEAGRLWVHQLQLTLADWLGEVHDTHHPVSSDLHYEDQRLEAARRAQDFTGRRLAQFLAYFERVLKDNPRGGLAGARLTYADLSLFQMVEGLRYAFPLAMARLEPNCPGLIELRDQVARRPNIARYLASERRLPFSEEGIFRRYPELDR
jgi:glutathione S-transferase